MAPRTWRETISYDDKETIGHDKAWDAHVKVMMESFMDDGTVRSISVVLDTGVTWKFEVNDA